MEIIYGSTNKHKVEQVQEYINEKKLDIKLLTLKDIGFNEEIEETGKTFEENSLIKAMKIKEFCNKNNIKKYIITDDTGLCIDYLNGAPGVYSARYAGEHATQEEDIKKVLTDMKNVPFEQRTAHFSCVLTLLDLKGKKYVARGELSGYIALEPGSMGGLTYAPIFIMNGKTKVMRDMPDLEISETHRGSALNELIEILKNIE